jgi:hypothetical protein
LATQSTNHKLAIDCSAKLIRFYSNQHPDQQAAFLQHYLTTLKSYETGQSLFVLPLLDAQSIRVIYGDRPSSTRSSIEHVPKEQDGGEPISWEDLERAAFHSLLGMNKPFHSKPLIGDEHVENGIVQETPPFEKFRVEIRLRNPLAIPLVLKNIRLGLEEVRKSHYLP